MAEEPSTASGLDETKLSELIGRVVGAEFDRRKAELPAPPAAPAAPGTPAPPAAPAPPTGTPAASQLPADLAALVNGAVERALKERDSEDQLAILAQQVDELRKSLTPERKRSWGSWIVGFGG